MAKPPSLQPGDVPNVQPVSLSAGDRKRFFEFVDPKVADHPAFDLPNLIGCIRQASRFTGFTPRIMEAGYEGAIDRLRHEERTGIRDNEIWARLQNPCCLDHVSYPYLAPLAADPRVSASTLRHAVELCLEQTAAWPRGERFNPRWEAARMATIMASAWLGVAGRPELRADKTAQREFALAVKARAGLPTLGLRRHPERLYRDEILGPWLAFIHRK